MRQSNIVGLGCAALAMVAGAASAQIISVPRDRGNQPDWRQETRRDDTVTRQAVLVPVDWVMGTRVLGPDRERLGEVTDIVIDPQRGRAVFGILEHGGVLGMGENLIPVPWRTFEWDPMNRVLSLPMSSERLGSAPRMDRDDWQRLNDPQFRDRYADFFGRGGRSDFRANNRWLDMVKRGEETTIRGTVRDIDSLEPLDGVGPERVVRIVTDDNRERLVFVAPAWFVDRQRPLLQEGAVVQVNAVQVRLEDGRTAYVARTINTPRGNFRLRDNEGRPVWDLGAEEREEDRERREEWREERREERGRTTLVRARDIRGQRVMDENNEELGRVETVVINPKNGVLGYAVLTTGSTLGIRGNRIAVPWQYFDVNQQGRLTSKRIEQDMLRNAPRIETRNWSELQDPAFERRVYQHFGAETNWERDDDFDDRRDRDRDRDRLDRDRDNRVEVQRPLTDSEEVVREHLTELQRKFAQGASTSFDGTVLRVNREGINSVVDLVVRTDGGERIVKLLPAAVVDQTLLGLDAGATVTVRGKHADIDGRRVVIAQEITTNGRTFNLRDRNGYAAGTR